MSKPLIQIRNIETGEEKVREMTDQEFATYKKEQENAAKDIEIFEAKSNAKSALLEKLGITADEAKLLLS